MHNHVVECEPTAAAHTCLVQGGKPTGQCDSEGDHLARTHAAPRRNPLGRSAQPRLLVVAHAQHLSVDPRAEHGHHVRVAHATEARESASPVFLRDRVDRKSHLGDGVHLGRRFPLTAPDPITVLVAVREVANHPGE